MKAKRNAGTSITANSGTSAKMHLSHRKDSDLAQDRKIIRAFAVPHTMLEVSRITGVERASICWCVDRQRKRGILHYCGKRHCNISGRDAGTYCNQIQQTPEQL